MLLTALAALEINGVASLEPIFRYLSTTPMTLLEKDLPSFYECIRTSPLESLPSYSGTIAAQFGVALFGDKALQRLRLQSLVASYAAVRLSSCFT